MQPCFFYTFLEDEKLKKIKCPCYCQKLEGKPKKYLSCENYAYCQCYVDFQTAKTIRLANSVINYNKEGIELINYNDSFPIVTRRKPFERKRLLRRFCDGYVFRGDVLNPWERLKKSQDSAAKRAQELVYSYIENNDWKYFITLTFSPHALSRTDDDAVKYEFKKFRQMLQYWDKDVFLLNIPEEHRKDGALHFHILMGTEKDLPICYDTLACDTWNKQGFYAHKPLYKRKMFLFPIWERGTWKKGRFGQPVFALSCFNKGRNFTAIIDLSKKHAAYNYVAKYVNKTLSVGYGKKRLYATSNLAKKIKIPFMSSTDEDVEIILDNSLKLYKLSDKYTVYRNYNVEKQIVNFKECNRNE